MGALRHVLLHIYLLKCFCRATSSALHSLQCNVQCNCCSAALPVYICKGLLLAFIFSRFLGTPIELLLDCYICLFVALHCVHCRRYLDLPWLALIRTNNGFWLMTTKASWRLSRSRRTDTLKIERWTGYNWSCQHFWRPGILMVRKSICYLRPAPPPGHSSGCSTVQF